MFGATRPRFTKEARARLPVDPYNRAIRSVRPIPADAAGTWDPFRVDQLEDLGSA
jgi:hypothetical protein